MTDSDKSVPVPESDRAGVLSRGTRFFLWKAIRLNELFKAANNGKGSTPDIRPETVEHGELKGLGQP